MNFKKNSKRYEDAGVRRARQLAGGDTAGVVGGLAAYVAGDKEVVGGAANPGTAPAALLDGMFDSINLEQVFGSGSRPESLDDFDCIAPQEQAMVFDFFRGLNAADEEMAVSHVEHCHYCKEAVGVMGTVLRAAGKERLHPASRGVDEAEADGRRIRK